MQDGDGTPADTRARILAAALDLFVRYGYHRTTLRQIAERLGLTKAAVLYHFPAKDRIVTALTEPLLRDLEAAVDRAARMPPEQARWAVLEGMLDAFMAHQRPLLMLRHDLAMLDRQPAYQQMLRIPMRAMDIVAGPDAGLAEQVRATQAVGIIGDPVLFFPDTPPAELRAAILDGARRLLHDGPAPGTAPTAARDAVRGNGAARRVRDNAAGSGADGEPPRARRTRRPVGRPRALSADEITAARRMYDAGGHSVDQIAASLGVSRATMYRHLNGT